MEPPTMPLAHASRNEISLLGLDRAELIALVETLGERAYRAKQLLEAVYRQRVESVEEISTLPQELRAQLAEKGITVGLPCIEQRFVSQDGTVRYLIAFPDGQSVETVWMPEGDGGEAGDGSDPGDEELTELSHELSSRGRTATEGSAAAGIRQLTTGDSSAVS